LNSPHSARDLEQIYELRFAGKERYRAAVWRVLASTVFSKWISPESVILDLGSGHCEFINNIQARVKYAMDLNPATASHASAGVQVLLQDCSETWQLPAGTLDVVFTSNFFEHLPNKAALEQTVLNAYRCLKPGGRLIALGPNIRLVGGAYWDFFDHYIPLSDLALVELFRKSGFTIECSWAKFLPYTMSDGRTYPVWALKAYLYMPLAWRIYGKQFLIVGRKPVSG
jgi:SAM-dependent methyltransferase